MKDFNIKHCMVSKDGHFIEPKQRVLEEKAVEIPKACTVKAKLQEKKSGWITAFTSKGKEFTGTLEMTMDGSTIQCKFMDGGKLKIVEGALTDFTEEKGRVFFDIGVNKNSEYEVIEIEGAKFCKFYKPNCRRPTSILTKERLDAIMAKPVPARRRLKPIDRLMDEINALLAN